MNQADARFRECAKHFNPSPSGQPPEIIMTIKSLALAAALTFSSTALAGPIQYGAKSGKLTRGEIAVLQADRDALARAKKFAMADGRVTASERARIRALERKLKRDTRALMTNPARR